MSAVRLSCNICPKKPQFCDISHLLTHVASKGHLSHYFKLQVRSRQEPAIRAQLDAYDEWYDDNHLEKLLSERMVLKESKKAIKRQGLGSQPQVRPTAPRPPLRLSRRLSKPMRSGDVLDPQLTRAHVKFEQPRSTHHLTPSLDPGSRHRAHMPRMGDPSAVSNHEQGLRDAHRTWAGNNDDTEDIRPPLRQRSSMSYPDPTTITHLPSTLPSDPLSPQFGKPDNGSSPRSSPYKYPLHEDGNAIKEDTKLKGVLWPGMSLFDSASPEARRKRNQRKDSCVLDQMSHDSAMIEAIESIYFLDGTLKKHRPITGNVESSPLREESPFLQESPIPKRRRARVPSMVLKDLPPNIPQIQKASVRGRKAQSKESLGHLSTQPISILSLTEDKSRMRYNTPQDVFGLADDDEIEWGLTYRYDDLTSKRSFVVFNDETEDEQQEQLEAPGVSEPALRRCPFLQVGTRPLPSTCGPCSTTDIMEGPRPQVSQYHAQRLPEPSGRGDQENILPTINHDGQIDSMNRLLHGQRSTQRYFSIYGTDPPQFFDALPSHMDFGVFGPSRTYGSTANPLNLNLQRHHVQSNHRISRPSTPDTVRSETSDQRQIRSYRFTDEEYYQAN